MLIELENPNLQFDRRRNRPPNGVRLGEYWDVLDMIVIFVGGYSNVALN